MYILPPFGNVNKIFEEAIFKRKKYCLKYEVFAHRKIAISQYRS